MERGREQHEMRERLERGQNTRRQGCAPPSLLKQISVGKCIANLSYGCLLPSERILGRVGSLGGVDIRRVWQKAVFGRCDRQVRTAAHSRC